MGEKRIFCILPPHLFHMLKPVADHHLARLECFNPSFTQKMRFLDIRICKNIQIITFTTISVKRNHLYLYLFKTVYLENVMSGLS